MPWGLFRKFVDLIAPGSKHGIRSRGLLPHGQTFQPTELTAPDRLYTSESRVLERVAKGLSADRSCCAHEHKGLLVRRRNAHARPRGTAKALTEDIKSDVVVTSRAPQSSRHRASARKTAMRRSA